MKRWTEKLDETNSDRYESKPVLKKAKLTWSPTEYKLEWGDQTFDGPHMVITNDDGSKYGCELKAFFTTHVPLEEINTWTKVAHVRAVQVDEVTEIITIVNGREESKAIVPAGHYLVQNPGEEIYYNSPEEFEKRYQLVDKRRGGIRQK